MQHLVNPHQYLKIDPLLHWQPVEFLEHWCYVFRLACAGGNACCHVLALLEFAGCGLEIIMKSVERDKIIIKSVKVTILDSCYRK